MKILILGAAGFIGNKLAHELSLSNENEIFLVDNYFRGRNDEVFSQLTEKENCRFLNLDLTKSESFNSLDNNFDKVYFLASVVGVGYTTTNPSKVIEINTKIIINTLDWLRTLNKNCKILFSSTSECYASTIEYLDGIIPTAEDVPLSISNIQEPRYSYALTKMLGEAGLIHYCNELNLNHVIVRYHNVYGPRMGFSHVIPQVVKRFIDNENPFKIFGYNQTRSFNYIDDAVRGTILAMDKDSNHSLFHLGCSKSEITIEKLIKFIGELLNFDGEFEYEDAPSGSVNRRCPDISLAQSELGYEPKTEWKKGVESTVFWYKDYYSTNKI